MRVHVAAVIYRKSDEGSRCDKVKKESEKAPRLVVVVAQWVFAPMQFAGLEARTEPLFQLAVTISLWTVVMEYQQTCYFQVNSHNRTKPLCGPPALFYLSLCLFEEQKVLSKKKKCCTGSDNGTL